MVSLLKHLIASVAVLDHTEGFGVLTALIRGGLGHRLSRLSISFVVGIVTSSQLILCHQRIILLSYQSRVVKIHDSSGLFHGLEIRSVQLAEIDGLVAHILRSTLGHR